MNRAYWIGLVLFAAIFIGGMVLIGVQNGVGSCR